MKKLFTIIAIVMAIGCVSLINKAFAFDCEPRFHPGTYIADFGGDIRNLYGPVALGGIWNPECTTVRWTVIISDGGDVVVRPEFYLGMGIVFPLPSAMSLGNICNLKSSPTHFRDGTAWIVLVARVQENDGQAAHFTCTDDSEETNAGGIRFIRQAGNYLSSCNAFKEGTDKDQCTSTVKLSERFCASPEYTLGWRSPPTISRDYNCRCEGNACQNGSICYESGHQICTENISPTQEPSLSCHGKWTWNGGANRAGHVLHWYCGDTGAGQELVMSDSYQCANNDQSLVNGSAPPNFTEDSGCELNLPINNVNW